MRKEVFSRRAWAVAACIVGAFVCTTATVNTVFGFFLKPIAEEMTWPRSSVSLALLFVAIGAAIAFPIVGRLVDRLGVRKVVLPGIVLFGCSVAILSLLQNVKAQLYGTYFLVGFAGAVVSPVVLTKVVSGWYDKNRAFVLGLMGGLGNGAGATFMPVYTHWLIIEHGWRGAYLGLGVIIIALALPMFWFFLHEAEKPTQPQTSPADEGVDGRAAVAVAMRTSAFWIILVSIGLGAGCLTAVFAHVVPIVEEKGLSFAQATSVLSTFAAVTVAWQIAFGFFLDRFPRPWAAAPFFIVAGLGVYLLETGSTYPQMLAAAVAMGFGLGAEYGILPYCLSRYFGLKAYGAISGVVYGIIMLVMGLTPVLMDLVYDATGTYLMASYAFIGTLATCAALLFLLKPFPPLEQKAL